MALEFASWFTRNDHSIRPKHKAPEVVEALRQALAQPNDFIYSQNHAFRISPSTGDFGIGSAPAKREWVEPTDEEIYKILNMKTGDAMKIAKALLAKAKEKNT